jgi:hypothetical protein
MEIRIGSILGEREREMICLVARRYFPPLFSTIIPVLCN